MDICFEILIPTAHVFKSKKGETTYGDFDDNKKRLMV